MAEQFPSDTLREIADRARLALGADRALVLPLAGGEPLPPGPEGGPSLSAPIHIDGDPVATLVVSRDPGGAPFGEESALLSTVCELAAHAIAASRRADLRTEQLALVQAVASAVAAATAVDEAFRMAATVVFEHTRYSGVTATMVDRAAQQQIVVVDLGGDIAIDAADPARSRGRASSAPASASRPSSGSPRQRLTRATRGRPTAAGSRCS